jgi:hypothetical protein
MQCVIKNFVNSSHERSFPVPREVLDTLNSVSWFFMDAFWMLGFAAGAYTLILPTVLSGLLLLYVEKRRSVTFINLAINCWIWMNVFWMIGDLAGARTALLASRVLFALGLVSIGLALATSRSLMETFSHFKRFRVLKF